ncbi:uncharacterized protein LAESUDRAFT_761969 [Laetiporus sulphureus 93-53]|uniref:Uncharacterized protein n=1 Tax=Laetiporus sulphureus 93-53 TaxID=1314785 RepID=A0A165CT50_9APHY|nr:uncharacterized protein LAESUDRAFT_761969 [Laetiporus sulphureus 93-53]KZT03392.1 hypothetical protein LAESUDRAFT_761969 [Laetiporus sulphureus 93-53]
MSAPRDIKSSETGGAGKNVQRQFLQNSNYSRSQLEQLTVCSTPNGKGIHLRWYYDNEVESPSRKKGSPALDLLGLPRRETMLRASEAEVMQVLSADFEEDRSHRESSLEDEGRIFDIDSMHFDPATIAAIRQYFALTEDDISDYRLMANLVSIHKAEEKIRVYEWTKPDPASERRSFERQRYRMKAQKAYEQAVWQRAEKDGVFDELERREREESERQEFEQGSSKGKGRR